MSWKWLLLVPLLAWLAWTGAVHRRRRGIRLLTQFGRRVAVFDGGDPTQAGLHVKLPWPVQAVQSARPAAAVVRPRRAPSVHPRSASAATPSTRRRRSTPMCAGGSPERTGADRFVRTLGSVESAQLILGQRVASELGAAIAELELDDLVSTEASRVDEQRQRLRQRLLDGGTPSLRQVLDDYGIEVVDVRLRRTSHPLAVRDAIFDRIRSERAKKAADYQSEGERLAADIRSASEREVAQLKADAEARAIELRGSADAEADRIRNQAQRADPAFYAFLKKLEDYGRILGDGKSTLLLSTHRELFDLLYQPPAATAPPSTAPTAVRRPEK
ncbi:MAG: SPFH domain-containing protein [Gemmataceae bacterium]